MHLPALPTVPRAFALRRLTLRLLVTLSLTAGTTLASPEYPSVVADVVEMKCTPDCTLCHESSPGNGSPVVQPFAFSVAANGGLSAANPDQLRASLTNAMAANPPPDSDGDLVPDFVELKGEQVPAGFDQDTTNPNVPEGESAPSADICPPEPVYGCGAAHVAPEPHVHGDYLLFGLLGAGLLTLALWRRAPQRRG
jgi:hypothetical protein